jgi:large subunit ribosomal protein L10
VLRAEKAKVIDDLHAAFNDAAVVVVTHYKGLSVPEITELRTEMRKAGATFRVAKNRLAKLAVEGTAYANLGSLLSGPTAVALSSDPVAAAKVANAYARKNDKLKIVGGGLGSTVLDPAAVKALAELPSLDEVRASLIALLQTPATRLATLLQAPAAQVARCLSQRGEQADDAAVDAPAGDAPVDDAPAASAEPAVDAEASGQAES